jgi:5-methylcytosine-specific restriction endonuclease McrA
VSTYALAVDASYRPIGLVPVKDAVAKIACDLADGTRSVVALVSDEARRFRSRHLDIAAPVVVQWPGYVELEARETRRVSRRVLFARDAFTCQYCGLVADPKKAHRVLTVDHVKPAHLYESRAAATTWDNVTTACWDCNQKKAGHLPFECGMFPARVPKQPTHVQLRFAGRLDPIQRDYVRAYFSDALGDLDDLV